MIYDTCDYAIKDFRIKTKSYESYNMDEDHFHDAYEIYYLNSGSRKYFINDKTYTINSGTFVMIKPYVIHKTMETGVKHSRVLLSFRPDYLPYIGKQNLMDTLFEQDPILKLDGDLLPKIEHILTTMIHLANDKPYAYDTALQVYLGLLMVELGQTVMDKRHHQEAHPGMNEKVSEVIHYLKENYAGKITLEQLSEDFYINRYYLCHAFKKATGLTILQYVNNLRIIEAQTLLRETNMKIIEIANQVGFVNVSAFGKAFKAISNDSPKSYRSSKKMERL